MERKNYYCKYCGKKSPGIQVMTDGQCENHPKATNKGLHTPASHPLYTIIRSINYAERI